MMRSPRPSFVIDRTVERPWLGNDHRGGWIGPSLVVAFFFAVLAVAAYFGAGS